MDRHLMDAFRLIYERYYGDVRRFALFLTGDRTRADDLTSETFVRAWLARDRIHQDTVKAYLLTIARNLHRDQFRADRRFVELADTVEDASPGVEVQAEHRSTLQQVRARLRRVAKGDRRALLMYVFKEMSYADVAAALGISVGATKSRIRRAREALAAPPAVTRPQEER
jgi:RNA polymerase sigma-70 factor (ECF subfamily)